MAQAHRPKRAPRVGDEPRGDVAARVNGVAESLVTSVRAVLGRLPGPPTRPQELIQSLGLNRDIAGKVLSAARAPDALAAMHVMPGPESLRRLLRAARRRNVPESLLRAAEEAVRQFEILIDRELGDRGALDALLSAMTPEARAGFELASKQIVFKGMSQLRGALADLYVHAAMVHPSTDAPDRLDVVHAYGTLGLHRLRPGVVVKFTYHEWGSAPREPWRTLDGKTPDQSDGSELDAFCGRRPARIDPIRTSGSIMYALAGDEVGPNSAVDKLLCEVHRGRWSASPRGEGGKRKSLSVAASIPTRMLVFDVLLHERALPSAEPQLLLYDTAVEGMASVNDRGRDADRIDLLESIQFLGRGAAQLHVAEAPTYVNMLRHVAGYMGWRLEEFRGYRCRVQYPVHASQVMMAFNPPAKQDRFTTERTENTETEKGRR